MCFHISVAKECALILKFDPKRSIKSIGVKTNIFKFKYKISDNIKRRKSGKGTELPQTINTNLIN